MQQVAGRDSIGTAGRDSARAAGLARAHTVATRALVLDATEPRALDVMCADVDDDSAFAANSIALLELAHAHYPNRTVVTGGLVRAYARVGRLEAAQALLAGDAPLAADAGAAERARDAIDQAALREARELLHSGKSAEAAEVYRKLKATTRDPGLVKFLDEQLQRLDEFQASNQWIDRYNAAVAEVHAGHMEQAETMFQDVHDHSPDPALALEAGKHAQEIRDFRAKQGARRTR
jgi:tetratricopeptide (TPR) repeat protein